MALDLRNYEPAFAALDLSFLAGTGAPTMSAAKGSIYIRTDGSSSSTRLYINSDGATSWVAITTAS